MNNREKQSSFFRFEDLRLYEKILDYIKWLDGAIKPSDSNYTSLCEDFFKSARNIALCLVEGSSRNKAQFIHYIKLSKSAIRECVVYTEIATRLNLISEEMRGYSRTQLMDLTKMSAALMTSLQKVTPSFKDENDEFDEIMNVE